MSLPLPSVEIGDVMVRKTHSGRAGYRTIPRDYGERLATAANQLHTAECEIRAQDQLGVFNPTTGAYDVTPGALRYSGSCRVQRVLREKIEGLASQDLPSMGYLVSVDKSVDSVLVRDIVTVTACVEDPSLVGQELPVAAVVRGSMRSVRDLFCIDDLTT
jgi:hypothetical protein